MKKLQKAHRVAKMANKAMDGKGSRYIGITCNVSTGEITAVRQRDRKQVVLRLDSKETQLVETLVPKSGGYRPFDETDPAAHWKQVVERARQERMSTKNRQQGG